MKILVIKSPVQCINKANELFDFLSDETSYFLLILTDSNDNLMFYFHVSICELPFENKI